MLFGVFDTLSAIFHASGFNRLWLIPIGFVTGAVLAFFLELFGRWRTRIGMDNELRKLDAKKLNEHLKLFGSFCNTLGAAIIGAAFIVPYIGQHGPADQISGWWVAAGGGLPLTGQIMLRFMRSES